MVTLIAKMKAKPGKEKALIEECIKIANEVREKEQDCLMYIPHVSQDNPAEILFVEKYSDQSALDFHSASSYFNAFADKFDDLLDGPPELQKYDELV
ncbi:MAG: putative quinol monooxygenase [Bacillota bacterium]|nr:antibiotic biosynthesis monooxygenase [Clostridia bacterium]